MSYARPVKRGQIQNDKNGKSKPKWVPAKTSEATVDWMYLSILSRYPTAEERETAVGYINTSGFGRRDAAADVVWALLNTKEFIFRH